MPFKYLLLPLHKSFWFFVLFVFFPPPPHLIELVVSLPPWINLSKRQRYTCVSSSQLLPDAAIKCLALKELRAAVAPCVSRQVSKFKLGPEQLPPLAGAVYSFPMSALLWLTGSSSAQQQLAPSYLQQQFNVSILPWDQQQELTAWFARKKALQRLKRL